MSTKTLERLVVLAERYAGASDSAVAAEARVELDALRVWAIAGLSAFHGRLCSMAPGAYPENAAECADPKCVAWAKALTEEAK